MPEAMDAEPVRDDVAGHAEGLPEAPDIHLQPVLLTALFIVAFVAATLAGMRYYKTITVSSPNTEPARTFAGPALQRDPEADFARLLAGQRRRLTSYGWVDRAQGIARMPIEEAMRRLAGRGMAAYAAPVQPERTPPLGSRGGASGAIPSPGGMPGALASPASPGER